MSVLIRSLLGRVFSESAEIDNTKAKPNNTRWVFEVEQPEEIAETIRVDLLNFTSGKKIVTDVKSYSFVPASRGACLVHLWITEDNGTIVLNNLVRAEDVIPGEGLRVGGSIIHRVFVDVLHSATR